MAGEGTIAIALGGTDSGRSGLAVYVREVLPHLVRLAERESLRAIVFGTRREIEACCRAPVATRRLPPLFDRPELSAAYYLLRLGRVAAAAGADVLLLPAAQRRITRSSPIPTVAVVHDLAHLSIPGKYDRRRLAYARHAVVPALRRATELVADSQDTAGEVERWVGRQAVVVPGGVDAERFRADPRASAAARTALRLPRDYLLCVSRLEHPGKNHLRLLHAFHHSGLAATHDLVLAGEDWGAGDRIGALAGCLGLGDAVRRLGFVDELLLPGLVGGAAAVLMVGLREGFGLPILEALAAGRPVVASSTGALPEVAGGLAKLCDPMDEESISEALRLAVWDRAYHGSVGRAGPLHAASYRWQDTAAALLARVRPLCRSPSAPGSR